MRLFNQTNSTLRFDDGPYDYTWEPFGFVDVDPKVIEHVKSQKLQVDVAPVSPERRARQESDDAQDQAVNSEKRKLTQESASLKEERDAARSETERVKIVNASLEVARSKADAEMQIAKDRCAEATSERDALKRELASIAETGVAAADVAVGKLRAQASSDAETISGLRELLAKHQASEQKLFAKNVGLETAALEAIAKSDQAVAEAKALRAEVQRLAAEVDSSKKKK